MTDRRPAPVSAAETGHRIRPTPTLRVGGLVAMLSALSLVLVLALAALSIAPPDTSGAGSGSAAMPRFGVQFHATWDSYTDAERAQVLDTLRANGVTSVRIDVSWAMLQPDAPGIYSEWGASLVDSVIRMAADRGLTPMVTLWLAPEWANGSDDERVPPSSSAGLAGLTQVARDLADKYRGVVSGWEVWNEPNSKDYMRGASPTTYAKVLRAAYAGFKAGDPDSIVVFGGVMHVDSTWVRRALAAGAAGRYDVMGVHPYQGVADEAPDLPDIGTRYRMRHLPAMRAVMAKYGDGAKPMWFTEFGWRVGTTSKGAANWLRAVTAKQAARNLEITVRMVASEWSYVERIYWYKDRADSDIPSKAGYGLVLPDGSPMPALSAVPAIYATTQPARTPTVKVKAIRGASRLHVNVNPNRGREYWSFRVQRQRSNATWATVGTYRTKGTAETRTINLKKGTYRVVLSAKFGYGSATSARATLKR